MPSADLKIPAFGPINDRLVVLPDPVPEKAGLIHIPDSAREAQLRDNHTGRIVAFGPGMLCKDGSRWPMPDAQIGDRIVYGPRQGTIKITVDGVDYLSLRQEHCLAVLDPIDGSGTEISAAGGNEVAGS